MLVYRIEGHDGLGMYWSNTNKPVDFIHIESRHPNARGDSLLKDFVAKITEDGTFVDYIYGFASIEQLRNWLYQDTWLMQLHLKEYKLAIYDMPDEKVHVGHTQVMFIRGDNVTKHSIKEFFKLDPFITDDPVFVMSTTTNIQLTPPLIET